MPNGQGNIFKMNVGQMAESLGLRTATAKKSVAMRNARLAAVAARKFNNALESILTGQRNALLRVLAAIEKERTAPNSPTRANALRAQRNALKNAIAKVNEQVRLIRRQTP